MTASDRGFTLLEVLLAMTVLAVVVAMLTLSLSGSMRVFDGAEQDEEIYSMAQTALQRISEDLASAFASKDSLFVGESVMEDGHRADTVQFCSLAHVVFNPEKQKPGLGLISYRLEEEPGGGGTFRLVRSDQLLLPVEEKEEDSELSPAFILADDLRSFQLTYFDRTGQEFDNWPQEVEQQPAEEAQNPTAVPQLPAAVHCILEFWDDREEGTTQIFSTRVLLPVGASGAK